MSDSINKESINEQALDYQEGTARQKNKQLGTKILTQSGFEGSHKEIVDSSFNKALQQGEKLPGKNNERRNLSYLNRLERLIDKHGNKLEKKLWDASVQKIRIIQPEDFTDAYWSEVEQNLRDNGYGHTLQEWEKEAEIKNAQETQRDSLKEWANYLGDESSPYPMWFKVYAWNGMSKMGGYNKEKHRYEKRDQHTVAPYPACDPEILSTIYGYINDFYNTPEHALYTEDGTRDKELEAIVASGNFGKLYTLAESEKSPIVPTPENPEDIHGEWVAYRIGDERAMARASRGTGWCTKNPSVARSYLQTSSYGQIEFDEDYYKDDSRNQNSGESKATFWVFHLYDPNNPSKLAQNGCLAILVDANGNVTNEVRGLAKGEDIEDALIPTLEQKLNTLPGNKNKLAEVLDRKKLIALDRKMQKGEDLTKEELEFLYEIHRPIAILGTYNDYDPRIEELKERYGVNYALDNGIDIDQLVFRFDSSDIIENLDTLINHGANIDQLVSKLHSRDIAENLDTLIDYGANIDIDQLVSKLDPCSTAENLDTLIDHDANIDIDDLVSHLNPSQVSYSLETLIKHHADINNIVSNLDPWYTCLHLDTLSDHKAKINIDDVVSHLESFAIIHFLPTLMKHHANIDNIVSNLRSRYIQENVNQLRSYGADIILPGEHII